MSIRDQKFVLRFNDSDLDSEVTFLSNGEIIVHKDKAGHITATRNRCRHQSGRFDKTNGCVLTCPQHGWKLDVSTMTYENPVGGLEQEELVVERTQDGELFLYDAPTASWDLDSQDKEILNPLEFTIRFYAHACMEVRCGSKSLFTDPWLLGPAFTRGWWLLHQPPPDYLDRLASADAVYISHNHSDHLNVHTLKDLARRNLNIVIFIPEFDNDYCSPLLKTIGFTNVTVAPFGRWMSLGEQARFMILRDSTGRSDSGILIDYKGHRLLNTVDCKNLNNGHLPTVQMLLTSFAGGASGYPVCWEDYSERRRTEMIREKCQAIVLNVLDTVLKTRPEIYVPFAGYFAEAHPSDHQIKRLNVKNSPQEVCEFIRKHCPDTRTWIPQPGAVFDIGLGQPREDSSAPGQAAHETVVHDFEPYLEEIRDSMNFTPLRTREGLQKYFAWAGFRGNMVLHVIETDENFKTVVRQFYVDFQDLSFPRQRPPRNCLYLRMRCRSDVFRHVLRNGLPWEEISIGFQARFFREPDVYEFDFWNHFQNKLPQELLRW